MLAFRLIRGCCLFVIPDWESGTNRIENKAFERADDPNGGEKEITLPSIYEGYHLYQGLVRGDSIWIEM